MTRAVTRSTSVARRASAHLARGITRHGAIAAQRVATHPPTRRTANRASSLVAGSALIGAGVAMFVRADFGLPPYDVLLSVISDRLGVTLGQAGWVLGGILLLTAALLGQLGRPSTLAYIVLNGVTIDAGLKVLRSPDALGLRIAFVGFGIVAIAGGISLVVHSGNRGGAFELLMRAGAERGIDPMRVRTGIEVSLLTVGIVAGGDFGPATVLFALMISPVMRMGRQALDDHRTGRRLRVAEVGQDERLVGAGRR